MLGTFHHSSNYLSQKREKQHFMIGTVFKILIWASRFSCVVCSLLAHKYGNTFFASKITSFEISDYHFILTITEIE